MEQKRIEQELKALTRRDLMAMASRFRIVGRHRMNKGSLVEALVLPRMYQALPKSPEILQGLTKKDLLQLCTVVGTKAGKGLKKAELVRNLKAQTGKRKTVKGKERAAPGGRKILPTIEKPETRKAGTEFELLTQPGSLPDAYDKTRVVLLPVHPFLVYVYWEVTHSDMADAKRRLGRAFPKARTVLRFFDVTYIKFDGTNAHGFFDLEIDLQCRQWYVPLWSPEKTYFVDLGFKTKNGRFFPIVRSNIAHIPRMLSSGSTKKEDIGIENSDESGRVEAGAADSGPGVKTSATAVSDKGDRPRAEKRKSQPEKVRESKKDAIRAGNPPDRSGDSERIAINEAPSGMNRPSWLVPKTEVGGKRLEAFYRELLERSSSGRKENVVPQGVSPGDRVSSDVDITEICEKNIVFGLFSGQLKIRE